MLIPLFQRPSVNKWHTGRQKSRYIRRQCSNVAKEPTALSRGLQAKITSTFIRAARLSIESPWALYLTNLKPQPKSLSRLFLLLRTFWLYAGGWLFLLHWLIWLDYGFLLRSGLLRIAMLWVAN